MSRNEIFEKIKDVFGEFFDGKVEITRDTSCENLEEWDSIAHIQLIFEIEEVFGMQFEAEEIGTLNSINKIVERVEKMEQ